MPNAQKKKAVVTGAGGFVGRYLVAHLNSLNYEVWGTMLSAHSSPDCYPVLLDLRSADEIKKSIADIQPDEIYHLAAISRPATGQIKDYYDINVLGTINVLGAVKELALATRILVVTSGYVYGSYTFPVKEDTYLRPVNHYGISKASADMVAFKYALDGLHVVRARPFNHSGPGQSHDFLLPSLVQQLVAVETSQQEAIKVGNLESIRDFCDVRDVVKGYVDLLRYGHSGDVYNVASGVGRSGREILELLLAQTRNSINVEVEALRFRPDDIPYLVGNTIKLHSTVQWQPTYSLEQTLQEMIAFSRSTTDKP
jgi:GDP-4-dehydro-6-deoxy-D-mannose reductase